jgi:RND superfamily putative drug exporter
VVTPVGSADRVATTLRGLPGVISIAPAVVSGDLARLDVTTASPAPLSAIREAVPGALVGGSAAIDEAVAAAQAHDRKVVIPLVLLVVFLVLVLLVRALVAPVLLMVTVVASYFAALGVGWFAFQHVFGFAGMDVQVMLIGFLFLVALGVDYNIFLVSRIRQEVRRHGHREGVLRGLAVTGGVISSAGIVLAATFSVLLLAPYVAFIEIGFVVAVGVLIDTLLVRSVLVPALALDVGHRFWWPASPSSPADPVVPATPAMSTHADVPV